jgi:hypothetical protein
VCTWRPTSWHDATGSAVAARDMTAGRACLAVGSLPPAGSGGEVGAPDRSPGRWAGHRSPLIVVACRSSSATSSWVTWRGFGVGAGGDQLSSAGMSAVANPSASRSVGPSRDRMSRCTPAGHQPPRGRWRRPRSRTGQRVGCPPSRSAAPRCASGRGGDRSFRRGCGTACGAAPCRPSRGRPRPARRRRAAPTGPRRFLGARWAASSLLKNAHCRSEPQRPPATRSLPGESTSNVQQVLPSARCPAEAGLGAVPRCRVARRQPRRASTSVRRFAAYQWRVRSTRSAARCQ